MGPSPTNLTPTPTSSTEIKLTWKDNSTNESYFLIYNCFIGGFITLEMINSIFKSYFKNKKKNVENN